ncbi:hypothetical protein GCM10018781_29220 [Kitasatospora indigofera]|uniref:Uncharacterized protein n=1 Tax=Kitasatospora indigofera TaxID=67307 RepID=A0A919KRS4_9ACTN|nr:hypothetical protein [Kitasatospora indigofera]GHH69988.1 hypothetical protein GCM10018781_29220 [Kitasatospora indigofera]
MNASVINRFAKIVTAGSAKGRSRRLALTLPLAAVIAAGAVGCTPDSSPQAAPTTAPTLSTPAGTPTPTSTAPTTTATPAPTTTPTATETATTAPAPAPATAAPVPAAAGTPSATRTPTSVVKPGGGIEIRFDGLKAGQRIEAGGGTVSFSVTWTNTGTKRYDTVVPVVSSQQYEGAPCTRVLAMAHGTVERKDGNVWHEFPLSQGGGMDYATTGTAAAFPLASGASRTIQYRIHLAADNGPGTLSVEAASYGNTTTFNQIGNKKVVDTEVVDSHLPKVTVTGGPGAVVVGGQGTRYTVKVTNPTGSAFRSAAPALKVQTLTDPDSGDFTQHVVSPGDLFVMVQDHGQWRALKADYDCDGYLAVDTTSLQRTLGAGTTAEYTFRIGVDKGWAGGTKLPVQIGATADGHTAPTVKVTPSVSG